MELIFLIRIYKKFGYWFFDDEKRGLYEQPFGEGFIEFVEFISNKLKADTIDVIFSDSKFDSFEYVFMFINKSHEKYWYESRNGMIGWLSPIMLKYFDEVPRVIYAKFKKVKNRYTSNIYIR